MASTSAVHRGEESGSEISTPKRRLNTLEIQTQWNLDKLGRRIKDVKDAISLAEEFGLLPTFKNCRLHRCPMPIYTTGSAIGFFRCEKGTCKGKKKISRAKDTWFEESRLSVGEIFYLMYCFARKLNYEMVQIENFVSIESTFSSTTIADWFNYCREVVVAHFLDNQEEEEKIGGEGKVVQIDESKFGRRKFNKGRRVDGHWVLGMIEDGSEDLRLEVCPENVRSAEVLIPLIRKHVLPGTVIHTDYWKAYDCLKDYGYIHKKVNHSDPDNPFVAQDGTHTQRIESQWRVVKREFYNDSYSNNFANWVVEYQWRRKCRKHFKDPFDALIEAIRHEYGDFRS